MPRIPPTLLRHARRIDRLLPPLLPVCRDLSSSQNELRWLAEHAAEVACKHGVVGDEKRLLQRYVTRRARGEPLQYILGTEFFGDLEIACRPGVLIPRQETAASVSHLAKLLLKSWQCSAPVEPVNILDLCTGTGCIPLLLYHELCNTSNITPGIGQIVGVDISLNALSLAKENKAIQLREQHGQHHSATVEALRNIQFIQADILADLNGPSSVTTRLQDITPQQADLKYDILISNPPYISTSAFRRTTAASVRKYEPTLALVPPPSSGESEQVVEDGDLFYPKLYEIAQSLSTNVLLFEVADMEQAKRVAAMAGEHWDGVEIWRDDPDAAGCEGEHVDVGLRMQRSVRVVGRGNGRSVVAYTGEGKEWVGTCSE